MDQRSGITQAIFRLARKTTVRHSGRFNLHPGDSVKKLHPDIDPDAPAWRVASLWKTNSKFARAIGRAASTTHEWLVRGVIPHEAQADIIAAAKRDRKPLKPEHFVDRRLFASIPPAPPIEARA